MIARAFSQRPSHYFTMPGTKQQKLNLAAKKVTQSNDPTSNQHDPMEDVDVHPNATSANSSPDQSLVQDDETVAVRNDPPPIQYTRCDFKISIKGTTNDNYLDALQQIQTLFTHIKKRR